MKEKVSNYNVSDCEKSCFNCKNGKKIDKEFIHSCGLSIPKYVECKSEGVNPSLFYDTPFNENYEKVLAQKCGCYQVEN